MKKQNISKIYIPLCFSVLEVLVLLAAHNTRCICNRRLKSFTQNKALRSRDLSVSSKALLKRYMNRENHILSDSAKVYGDKHWTSVYVKGNKNIFTFNLLIGNKKDDINLSVIFYIETFCSWNIADMKVKGLKHTDGSRNFVKPALDVTWMLGFWTCNDWHSS